MFVGAYCRQAEWVVVSGVGSFQGGDSRVCRRPHCRLLLEASSFSSFSSCGLLQRWVVVSSLVGTSLEAPSVVSLRLDPVPNIEVVYRSAGHFELICLWSLDLSSIFVLDKCETGRARLLGLSPPSLWRRQDQCKKKACCWKTFKVSAWIFPSVKAELPGERCHLCSVGRLTEDVPCCLKAGVSFPSARAPRKATVLAASADLNLWALVGWWWGQLPAGRQWNQLSPQRVHRPVRGTGGRQG